jgi:hypothetical protein
MERTKIEITPEYLAFLEGQALMGDCKRCATCNRVVTWEDYDHDLECCEDCRDGVEAETKAAKQDDMHLDWYFREGRNK